MRGKPAGSPISWPRFRWYGEGEPTEGDLVVTVAGHAAYIVEEAHHKGPGVDDKGPYDRYRLQLTKLDPAEVDEPFDWFVRFD